MIGHLRSEIHNNPAFGRIDFINAGIKGYTNYQELLYLKKDGLKLEPDLVGIGFCLNDLFKFLHSFNVENGRIVPGSYRFSEEALNRPRSQLRRLADKSFLIVWLETKFHWQDSVLQKTREICERLGIPLYDLYPDMNASFFSQDRIHLTKPGRKMAGNLIARFLTQSQLLPLNRSVTQPD